MTVSLGREATAVGETPRLHPLSWGAEFVGTGEVQFRLWAPAANQVLLRLHGNDAPMTRSEDGWHEIWADGVAAGDHYQFVLEDGRAIADPASRQQASSVDDASVVTDPTSYEWQNADWTGRPWHEAVIYELHIGTFTEEGTYAAAVSRLKELADSGFTAIEIMPLATFYGDRGWGYDGLLQYAPHPAYGSPEDLKRLIDEAHGLGLMVLLDIVYNHFGPFGNELSNCAPSFFRREGTPWGPAPDLGRPETRQYLVDNALYWLDEFFFDGLRFDAADHLVDDEGQLSLLEEIAAIARTAMPNRRLHFVIEDARNVASPLEAEGGQPPLCRAEWNDDFHHVVHAILTGEESGHYADFAENKWHKLRRALAEGFVYQGDPRPSKDGAPWGEPSGHLPPTAFINFLQNHDQVGNRLLGERLRHLADKTLVQSMTTILLLSPQIPLMFMGDEFGTTQPFCFFCDHPEDVRQADFEGRLREAGNFQNSVPADRHDGIPDPNDRETFLASKLDWSRAETSEGRWWRNFVSDLLDKRRRHIWPLIATAESLSGEILPSEDGGIAIDWNLSGRRLELRANLHDRELTLPRITGRLIHEQLGPGTGASKHLASGQVVFAINGIRDVSDAPLPPIASR
ncbi:malto-oligosyltrehalose trehalohydrolase [Pseudomonas sp. R2.Fl]|nr:malto-oligosyltrehalose trehalohydrolase [Pseudomonas sp. R2.Fl]